jgi:hypothetical protein
MSIGQRNGLQLMQPSRNSSSAPLIVFLFKRVTMKSVSLLGIVYSAAWLLCTSMSDMPEGVRAF